VNTEERAFADFIDGDNTSVATRWLRTRAPRKRRARVDSKVKIVS
jgi:hypothetical protein